MPGGPFLGRSNLLTRRAATTTRWLSKAASQLGLYPEKGGGGRAAAAMGPTGSRPSIDPTLHNRAHDCSPLQSSVLDQQVGYLWTLLFRKMEKIHEKESVRNQQKKVSQPVCLPAVDRVSRIDT